MQAFVMPGTDSWLEKRSVLLVLKFLAEKGSKDGFISLNSIKIRIDGVEMTYEQLGNIDPRTNKEIIIVRPDRDNEKSPF